MRPPPTYPPEYDSLESIQNSIWTRLTQSVRDRHCPGHTPTFGSLAEDGSPRLRTVVLRGCDLGTRSLMFHTDLRSPKWQQLQRDPRASMHFYFPEPKLQYRVQGRARLEAATDGTQRRWEAMDASARDCYRVKTPPGTELDKPISRAVDTAGDHDGYAEFARVHLEIHSIDWLYLAAAGHLRARFTWDAQGSLEPTWLAP